jgi:hypothetical protein
MNEEELLLSITEYFEKKIFEQHKKNVLEKHSKLKSYKINPITVKYLSKILDDNYTPEGIAKALYYPRVLGTSITTTFGTGIQKMFVELGLAEGSLIKGMDIEFIDKVDNRRKYCQLKSGPNTINSGDVSPLKKKFSTVANLSRTNALDLNNTDLILGVLYGSEDQLSQHYRKIDETYPVIIGVDFWNRLTGFSEFYYKVVASLDIMINDIDSEDFFRNDYLELVAEIETSDLFDFS